MGFCLLPASWVNLPLSKAAPNFGAIRQIFRAFFGETVALRVMTFNCNGVRAAARKGFFDWLATGDTEPLMSVAGPNTYLAGPYGLAVDATGGFTGTTTRGHNEICETCVFPRSGTCVTCG